MKLKALYIALSLIATSLAPPINAAADDREMPPSLRTPLIDAHLERMRARILQGIRSGELSTGEAHSLTTKLERVIRLEDKLKRDQSLKPRDRLELRRESMELSDAIFKEKRDANTKQADARR